MKFKKLLFLMFLVISFFVYTVPSIFANQAVFVVDDFNVNVVYADANKNQKTASIKSSIHYINRSPFIGMNTLSSINTKAGDFLIPHVYQRYNGYFVMNIWSSKYRVEMEIGKKEYIVSDRDNNVIKKGKFREAPYEKDEKAYIPLDAFKVLGANYIFDKNNVNIYLTLNNLENTYITGFDVQYETLTIKSSGKENKYKLIGVDFPDDQQMFKTYTLPYLSNLVGKNVVIKYDNSKTVIKQDEYFYVYLYLPNESVSINEDILRNGNAYYYEYNVGTELNERLLTAEQTAKEGQLGLYKEKEIWETGKVTNGENPNDPSSRTYKVIDAIETSVYYEEHGQGETVYTERKIILEQNGKTYVIDYLDPELSYVFSDYSSWIIQYTKEHLIGKTVELKVHPETNYEFALYFLLYAKERN